MSEVTAAPPAAATVNPYRAVRQTAWDQAEGDARARQARHQAAAQQIAAEEKRRSSPEFRAAREARVLAAERRRAEEHRCRVLAQTPGTAEYIEARAACQAKYEQETRWLVEDREDARKVAAFAEELRSARLKARAKEKRL